jgi:hypothetical protein
VQGVLPTVYKNNSFRLILNSNRLEGLIRQEEEEEEEEKEKKSFLNKCSHMVI